MNVKNNKQLLITGPFPVRLGHRPWALLREQRCSAAWTCREALRTAPRKRWDRAEGETPWQGDVTAPKEAGQPGPVLKAPDFSRGDYVTQSLVRAALPFATIVSSSRHPGPD